MDSLNRSVETLVVLVLFFSVSVPYAFAQEVPDVNPTRQATMFEPVDFVDHPKPQKNDTATQSRRITPSIPTGWGYAVFSPDGQTVATVLVADGKDTYGEVVLWDVNDPTKTVRYEEPRRISVVAFSPDGKWLAIGPAAAQSGLKIVDTQTGAVAYTLPGMVPQTNAITWSRDGAQLALASSTDKTVRLWSVADRKFIKACEPEASKFFAVAFTPAGKLMAAGAPTANGDGLALFDLFSGEPGTTLKGHRELIEAAAFSSEATSLVSVGWDAMVRVWDVQKCEEMAVMKGHKKGVRSVGISEDGKRLVSSNDKEFKLWDGEKKELIDDLGGDNSGAKFVTISPDGQFLVSLARDGMGHVWDVAKKTEKTKLERYSSIKVDGSEADTAMSATPMNGDITASEAIHSVAYSRDGQWFAIALEDGKIAIHQAKDGRLALELNAFSDVAACVVFSPDSQRIAAGSFDKSIKIWNVVGGELVSELNGHTNWVFSLAFSPDGMTLASGSYDKTIKIWNLANSAAIATLEGHTAGVRSVCFTTDGQQLISGSADRTAVVWNLVDRSQVAVMKGHAAAIRAVDCSPDGTTVATASEDSTVKLWKTADWTERASLAGTEGVMVWCIAYSPAGRTLAAGAFNGTVKLYDPVTGKERKTLQGPSDAITALAFAPGARELVGGSVDKSVHRWRAQTGASAITIAKAGDSAKTPELKSTEAVTALNAVSLNTQQPISSLIYNKDGSLLVIGAGLYRAAGALQLWDTVKREKMWQSEEFRFGLPAIAFSLDEKRLAIGNFADNFIRLMDASNGKQLKEIRGHRAKVTGIAYSPDGKYFATASLDRDIKLWDTATNKEIKTFSGHNDFVYSIAFSNDGKRLLSGSYDHSARLWDVESGQEITQLKGHQGAIQQAVYSRDGSMIATASSDRTVRIYDASVGNFWLTLRGHLQKVESVAFSPNGKLIATGSSDRTIRFWDLASGTELLKMAQEGSVRAVVFSPDGKYLASGCDDKTVKLWDVTGFIDGDAAVTEAKNP